jgi:nucleoside phosphorylase
MAVTSTWQVVDQIIALISHMNPRRVIVFGSASGINADPRQVSRLLIVGSMIVSQKSAVPSAFEYGGFLGRLPELL